ncbi:MAG: sigma 54-interacting transcriptional regulator [Desulfobacula sp.]|jgi:PAS domain S-box-containing protein/TyrR family helix-turn-helix protein|nr:sigma 54-interacting transcriptional regulator [Desulfobacula sp.]MBT7261182.1 sigma 54-interacting transcriptional regulator [Desulfobacula sp.]
MKQPDCSQILQNCAHGVIGTDVKGRIIHINSKAKEIIRFAGPLGQDTNVIDLLPATGKLILGAMESRNPYFGHQVEGKLENLIVSINIIEDKDEICGSVCSFVDLNEFKSVAHKLDFIELMDKKFETVFEASFDGIWLADGEGRIIKINKTSEKIMGMNRSKVIGKKVQEIVEQGVYDNYMTDEVIRTKKRVSQLQTALLTGKQILCTGIPVLDKNGEVSMVVINERDISQLMATQKELEDIRQEKDRYKEELDTMVMKELRENNIVAENEKMRHTMQMAVRFGRMNVSDILVQGESGTGKGLIAKFIHKSGQRSSKPFIQINCAALPDTILEAELFGYEKGAFTGANESGKPGLIELANEGTLFLDEIGDLSPAGQAKLLKYLDDHEVMRIGGTQSKFIDCVVIAASNQNLQKLVKNKKFRPDLLFRLNSISISLPPLRERPEDIFELTYQFLKTNNAKFNSNKKINPLTIAMMQTYSFPGNIRELKNIIKKGVIMSESEYIDSIVIDCIGKEVIDEVTRAENADKKIRSLEDITNAFEKEIIKNAIKKFHSTRELARHLNISQPTIVRKLKKHGLSTR